MIQSSEILMRTLFLFPLALSIGCTSDKGLSVYNTPPTVDITSPSEGGHALEGYTTTFEAHVSDANHPTADLQAQWSYGGAVVCAFAPVDENGLSTCDISMLPQYDTVHIKAIDPVDAVGTDEISLVVEQTQAPVAQIENPTRSSFFYSDQKITFQGKLLPIILKAVCRSI